jgi:hypothetical protein
MWWRWGRLLLPSTLATILELIGLSSYWHRAIRGRALHGTRALRILLLWAATKSLVVHHHMLLMGAVLHRSLMSLECVVQMNYIGLCTWRALEIGSKRDPLPVSFRLHPWGWRYRIPLFVLVFGVVL